MSAPVISRVCGHCGKTAAHDVVHAYTAHDRAFVAAFTRCPNCDRPGAALLEFTRGTPNDVQLTSHTRGNVEKAGWRIAGHWPDPSPPEMPQHLPPAVERYYWQAANALATTPMPDDEEPTFADSAVIMCRCALEAALRDIGSDADSRTPLADRIRRLADEGRITRALADWSDHIRLLGNAAAHGDQPLPAGPAGIAQASDVLEFTRLVLMYLYTLPGMVERARARGEAGRAP